MRIVVLSDLHYGTRNLLAPHRRSELGHVLLERAVRRCNELINPDIVLFPGDVLNSGGSRGSEKRMLELKRILGKLQSPCLVMPGNHDCSPDRFYRVFPKPADIVEIGDFRILPFLDRDEPGYNASREERQLALLKEARRYYRGKIIVMQHVSLHPPGMSKCPFNYLNAEAVIESMRKSGVMLSVSGHYHEGIDQIERDGITYVCAPAMCQKPFPFLVVDVNDDDVLVTREHLGLPDGYRLSDRHIHTQLAYCSENMDIASAVRLGKDFGLAEMGFAEHSDQLYFPVEDCRSSRCQAVGVEQALDRHCRFGNYIRKTSRFRRSGIRVGLEVECDFNGNPVLRRADAEKVDFMTGAVHGLKSLAPRDRRTRTVENNFLDNLSRFLGHGFSVLAHPFRIFRRHGIPTNPALFKPVVRMLKDTNTAAEVNFHTNQPPPEFFELCVRSGVKLTFGSDSHNLSEVGDFARHLDLMRRLGYGDCLEDILLLEI